MAYYGPPETDSEDDYDGFSFGDDFITKEHRRRQFVVDVDQELYDAIEEGVVEKVQQQVEMLQFKVDEPIKGGFTLLMHACRNGYLDIVRYLLVDLKANANKQVDSYMPLMLACDCKHDSHTVEQIVKLLLAHGAVINVSDKYGSTPFMHACKHGHTAVVRLLLKDVSFDAVDNQGCTPIFHAIEYNRPDIVKLLVDAGVNATIANRKGYTPKQVAQFHGFYDILELLPKEREEGYLVPTTFLTYNTLRDYIPRIFLKSECPEYFQEIHSILLSINMEHFLEFFAKERVSLAQFLCMTDERLQAVGIAYPIYRMKILKGLLDFHLHHWSKKSIARVSKVSQENFYEILMITANHLQHLVIINSSLRFIKQNLSSGNLGKISADQLQLFQRNINSYRSTLREIKKTTKYLASFSPPKNPLFIDYDEFVLERKRTKFKCFFKYTTLVIGISVFICLKVKKIF